MRIAASALAVVAWGNVWAASARTPCSESLTRSIPARPQGAIGGRALAAELRGLSEDEREARIQHELLIGNIPDFLRRLVPVEVHQDGASQPPVDVVVCAAPDYLAVGSDADFMLVPLRVGTALSVAARYGFTLPTPRIVDAIYAQAAVHFVPQPLAAGDRMRSTDYIWRHDEMIEAQRAALGAAPGILSAGHKKDLVLSNRLWGHLDRVAIYGWHRANGAPIQPLSTVHGWHYEDYSHGVRLISAQVFVDGRPRSIFEVMQSPRLAGALSREGGVSNMAGLIGALSARAQAGVTLAFADSKS
jgi:hypothetical protein